MKIDEQSILKASMKEVWDFLLDVQRLASCVPGCEKVEAIGENSYMVTEVVKIGPVSAKFHAKVTITEMKPPNYLVATMEGKDGKTSSLLNARTTISLKPISDNETRAEYVVDVTLSGLLGKFGEGMMRKKATSLAEEFTKKIRAHLEGKPA